MDNYLCDYRQAIGLFNCAKFILSGLSVCITASSILLLFLFLTHLLLLLSNDIEMNPGPSTSTKLKQLSVCHLNIRGLSDAKLRDIKTCLCDTYDIITLSETFLSTNRSDSLSLPGYHPILRRDRETFGGGVAMFINEDIVYKRMFHLDCPFIENMWVEISTKSGKLLLCTIYRPPNNNDFWDHITTNLEEVKSERNSQNIMLLGDLNADPSTQNGCKLKDLCNLHNLYCHINEPTRVTETTSTCLDQIISNIPHFISCIFVEPPVSTNDHNTVGVKVSFAVERDKAYYRHVWLYDQADYDGYIDYLNNVDWNTCFELDDIDLVCTKWNDTILTAAKAFIPNRTILVRPRDSPWFTGELRKMKRRLIRLYHKAKSKKTPLHWKNYKDYNREYHECLDRAEHEYNMYLRGSLRENRNTKSWWRTVKHILGKCKNESYPPMFDENQNHYVTTSRSKANLFNEFFISHSNVNLENARLPDDGVTPGPILENISITENDVRDIIKTLDVNKSTGHDGMSCRMIKAAGDVLVPPLTRLFNLCLINNRFPNTWKMANVLPLYKKDGKDQCSNYRPVSVLPIVSKLFERIIFKNVYNFFQDNKVLTEHQSGFRPGDSTVNQLAYLYHTFCEALDRKKDIRIIFFDISKAFDRVWHDGLIYKLKHLGINGNLLSFFKDYLDNRQQRVLIKGEYSEWGAVKAGVPQGSVLGPLLFLVYINDLVKEITCDIKLFADDTVLYALVDDQNVSAVLLNENLQKVHQWAIDWLVSFNPSKTKLMNISYKLNPSFEHFPLYFNNHQLTSVGSHKHLGIHLSDDLSWTNHIDKIINSVARYIDVLTKLKYVLDRKTLECVYFTFIRPKLEYAHIIWDDCTKEDKIKLEDVQLTFARIVTGAKRGTSHELLYDEVSWPKLSERRHISKLKFMHKLFYKDSPEYLYQLLPSTVNQSAHYSLRNGENIRPSTNRIEKFRKSLLPDCIRKWNGLPVDVRHIDDVNLFINRQNEFSLCNPMFYGNCRKLNIIHCQLRLQCSDLNAHLYKLHVVETPNCICSNSVEDPNHFFFTCHLYNNQRIHLFTQLRQLFPYMIFTVEVLLFGSKNLSTEQNQELCQLVEMYLLESSRFRV